MLVITAPARQAHGVLRLQFWTDLLNRALGACAPPPTHVRACDLDIALGTCIGKVISPRCADRSLLAAPTYSLGEVHIALSKLGDKVRGCL